MAISPSSTRRAARETALRILYMVEVGRVPLAEALDETIAANELDEAGAGYVRGVVEKTLTGQKALDEKIREHAIGYPPERQEIVDRNILRLSVAELTDETSETPAGVVANEAVELAKKYSTLKAAKFINGVLGAIIRERNPAAAIPDVPELSEV
jgi:transcription antitermination protein NusB